MIVWRLFEVKQHKYKLVLGWVTIWWVVLLIRIASDSEEPDLACTMTAIGNPSISRVPAPCFYSSTSSSVVK